MSRVTLREFLRSIRRSPFCIPEKGAGLRSWIPKRFAFATPQAVHRFHLTF